MLNGSHLHSDWYELLTDAHMTYHSMTVKSGLDCCQTDSHFDPNYQYDLSRGKKTD